MNPEHHAKRLPFRSKESRYPPERQHAGYARSSSRTMTPRSGSESVSARSDFKGDRNVREYHRGHHYSNVQAQENARMHLGDTYTAKTMIFQQLRHPTGTEEDEEQMGLLEALAFGNMDTRLASISAAQGDTCRWLFRTKEYRGWRRGFRRSRRRFLWIKGKPGAGKSTMMQLAFHQAPKDFRTSIIAAHFFNARGQIMAKSTQGMYRSLLHQIFSKLAQLPSEIPSSVAASLKKQGWPIPVLQNMLRAAILHLDRNESLVCYIDALDECAEDDIREAINHFEELASLTLTRNTRFLICFASRHYPAITIRRHREIDLDKQTGHQQDISDYVRDALRVSGSLGAELQQTTLKRSSGVFLWVVLTVRILNKFNDRGCTHVQLRSRLSEVPLGIQNMFGEILQEKDLYLSTTLQWVLFAQRSLKIKELYCAIMASTNVQPMVFSDETGIDDDGIRRFILTSSRGLVDFSVSESYARITESSGKSYHCYIQETSAQLIHESLREYLLQGGLAELDPSLQGDTEAIIHARLAEACQSYVSNAKQGSQPNGFPKSPFLHYAVRATIHHLHIAFFRNALSREVLGQFACIWMTTRSVLEQSGPFGRARGFCGRLLCLSLAKACRQISPHDQRRLLDALISTRGASKSEFGRGLRPRPINLSYPEEQETMLLLQAAVDVGSVDVWQLCRRQDFKDLFVLLLPDAMVTASALGLMDVLNLLIECVAGTGRSYFCDEPMLKCAAVNLQENATRFLLRRGVKPNDSMIKALAPSKEWTRPADGSEETRLRIMTTLLDAGADVAGLTFHECDVKRLRVLELLREGGAKIACCTAMVNVFTGTCAHGYSLKCRLQGKQV